MQVTPIIELEATTRLYGTIIGGGDLTHSYSVESGGEVKMTKQEIIEMIHRAGFEAVEERYGV